MSGWLEYVTTPEFWAGGVLLGSLSGVVGVIGTRTADLRLYGGGNAGNTNSNRIAVGSAIDV